MHQVQQELPRLLYSKREAAIMLGLSVRKIDYMIQLKQLPVKRIGARVMVRNDDLQKFVKAA